MSRGSLLTLWLDFSPTLLLRIKGVKIMEKDKDFLGTEPIGKLLLRLAIPTLAARLLTCCTTWWIEFTSVISRR